jgi:outer membrane protein TolC
LLSAVDLSAGEAAARDGRAAVLQARRDVEHQWLQLTRALGLPANDRPRLEAGLSLPARFDPPEAQSLCRDVESRRIDLIALQRGYDSQEQTLRAAVLDQFPKVNLGVNDASDNTNVHSVGLVATIDLPIFDRNQGVIASEKATRQQLFDELVGRIYEARADIATAVADLRALNDQIADAQAAIPNLQTLVDSYKKAMDLGNADVLSYYVAWNNLAQKKLGVLRLQQQLADTRVALELAAGRYFPDAEVSNPKETVR